MVLSEIQFTSFHSANWREFAYANVTKETWDMITSFVGESAIKLGEVGVLKMEVEVKFRREVFDNKNLIFNNKLKNFY